MAGKLLANGLTIGYRQGRHAAVVVARDLNLSLEPGELVCLLGPNGAGKTTLMRTLAGMQPPLAGQVLLDGVDIHTLSPQALAQRLSVVLTDRVDVGYLHAYDLVALGRYPYTNWMGRLTQEDHRAVRWALEAVGATALAHRPVNELSDGERQKVMIARALAQEPDVILLDEPTAFLDLPRRVEIMGVLRGLARRTHRAILLSTHDLDLALRSADRLWLLPMGGPLTVGAPEDLVLNGTFTAAFRSDGVTFDPYSGSFHISRQNAGVVSLQGEGLPALWTARALEREGFCVERNGSAQAPDTIHVAVDGDALSPRWIVTRGQGAPGSSQVCTSVMAMLRAVKGPQPEVKPSEEGQGR